MICFTLPRHTTATTHAIITLISLFTGDSNTYPFLLSFTRRCL
jgi:hypothetical protein